MEKDKKIGEEPREQARDRVSRILRGFYGLFLVLSAALVLRLIYIQWIWQPDPQTRQLFVPGSVKNSIAPRRGAIKDCKGRLLALSTPTYQLYMDCTVRKADFAGRSGADSLEREWRRKARAFAYALAPYVPDLSGEELFRKIIEGRGSGAKYLRLGKPVSHAELLAIRKLPLAREGRFRSGLIEEKVEAREYPYGTLARRTIGYVKDNSRSGRNSHIGLEGKYDYILHGKEGLIWLETADAKERIRNFDSTYVKPEDGKDVISTLNIDIQEIADSALRRQLAGNPSLDMGCAIIMEVRTGAIRAMVNLSRDTSDNSLSESYNMAIGYNSEPGSVFKATTLMTVLEDGYVKSLDDRIPTNGGLVPGYSFPRDDHVAGMKDISILHGFEISSNYVFRYLAVMNYGEKPKKFLDKLYMYNLGKAFDFDLDGLREPVLPSPESKTWSRLDLGSIGMGYAVRETPLHILTFYNAIANKGRMMKPYLVERIEENGRTVQKKGPSVLNASICSKATADTLLRAMRAVTTDGTARLRLQGAALEVAGKTGTSRQVLTREEIEKYGSAGGYQTRDGSFKNLGTFVCFFPADEPVYSAIICMKSGLTKSSTYGGVQPAAAMREIIDKLYALDPRWGESLGPKALVPKPGAKASV